MIGLRSYRKVGGPADPTNPGDDPVALRSRCQGVGDCPELEEHRQKVVDRPALNDAVAGNPVHERGAPFAVASRYLEAAKTASLPVVLSNSELDDEVVLGDDEELLPVERAEVEPLGLQPLAGSFEPRWPAGGQGVIHHVWAAQLVELVQVPSVEDGVESLHDGLVALRTHTCLLPFVIVSLLRR